jgi:hypothetical protein
MEAIGPTVMLAAGFVVVASLPAGFLSSHLRRTRRLSRNPKWPFAAAFVLALIITAVVRPHFLENYRVWYVDRFGDKLMARFESQQPIYRVLREHEPGVYAKVRVNVLEGLKRNASGDELTIAARGPLEAYMQDVMLQVPDRELVEMMGLSSDLTAVLVTANPQLCVDMILGRPYGNISQYMSSELKARELAVTEALVTAPKAPDRAKLPPEQMSNLLIQIIQARSETSGIPVSEFAAVGDGTLAADRACLVAREFLQAILDLPAEQAAPLLRALNDVQ